jgi:SAM-dependent methyltransferase
MNEPGWSSGYPVHRDYDYVFVPQMTPAHLEFVAMNQGVCAPDASRFRYFELGAGLGLVSLLMAATNPNAEVWANDFNPNHVVEARALAAEAGLENLRVLEDSFEELLERDLPEFDFIGLHGVYTWVSIENRRRIVEFIRRRLKVGGLVYLSYNCPAGFGPVEPLRRLMNSAAVAMGGSAERRLQQGFELINRLGSVDARYLGLKQILPRLEQVQKKNVGFLINDYLTRDWQLFLHTDVAKDLAEAKLGFVGSARLLDDLLPITFSAEQIELVRQIPDRGVQENVKDFIAARTLRTDVYAKGARRFSSNRERFDAFLGSRIALTQPRSSCGFTAKVQEREITLLEHVHGPVLDALAKAPSTLAELVELPLLAQLGRDAVVNALLTLLAVGYAAPYAAPEPAAKAAATRLNQAIARRALGARPLPALAAPGLRSGVLVSDTSQLFVRAAYERAEPEQFVLLEMRRVGQRLLRDGKPIESAEGSVSRVQELAREFDEAEAPLLRQLGVLD